MLVRNFHERMAMAIRKKRKILNFLLDETWSDLKNLSILCNLNLRTTDRTLKRLRRDGLIHAMSYRNLGGRFTLWGLTLHGLATAFEEATLSLPRKHFEPSKVAISNVERVLKLQAIRLRAENLGWTQWLNGRYLADDSIKRPDAIAINNDGLKIAIQLTFFIKTKRYYEQVMSDYLQAMVENHYDHVIFLSPANINKSLIKLFHNITAVPVDGDFIPVTKEHHDNFQFFSFEEWLADVD